MGEEAKTTEVGASPVAKVDLSLFRQAQRNIAETASNKGIFKEVANEDIKKSIGNDGEVDQSLFKSVDEYIEIMKQPYSVKFYNAKEIYNAMTEADFERIDKYVLDKIKSSHQKTTFEVYEKMLRAIEGALSLSDDHDTMHRIVTISKFIKNGT